MITNNLVDFCSDAYHDADPENCRKKITSSGQGNRTNFADNSRS